MITPLSLRSRIEDLLSLGYADINLEILDLSTGLRTKVNGLRHEEIDGKKRVALTIGTEGEVKRQEVKLDQFGKPIPDHRTPNLKTRI